MVGYKKKHPFENVLELYLNSKNPYDGCVINLDRAHSEMQILISETLRQTKSYPPFQGLLTLVDVCANGTLFLICYEPVLSKPIEIAQLDRMCNVLERKFVDFGHPKELAFERLPFILSKDTYTTVASARSNRGILVASYTGLRAGAKNTKIGRYLTMATLLYSSFNFITDDCQLDNSMYYMLDAITANSNDTVTSITISTMESVCAHY
jgi:hypothetical protein